MKFLEEFYARDSKGRKMAFFLTREQDDYVVTLVSRKFKMDHVADAFKEYETAKAYYDYNVNNYPQDKI